MPAVARIGDTSNHGGIIISGSSEVFAQGLGVARKGDLHSCPIPGHGITPLISASQDVAAQGLGVVRIGDEAGCGAIIISGSSSVFAN